MHLTNYAINKSSITYVSDKDISDIFEPNEASKRTLTSVYKQIAAQFGEAAVENLKASIQDISEGVMSLHVSNVLLNANPESPSSTKLRNFNGRPF